MKTNSSVTKILSILIIIFVIHYLQSKYFNKALYKFIIQFIYD